MNKNVINLLIGKGVHATGFPVMDKTFDLPQNHQIFSLLLYIAFVKPALSNEADIRNKKAFPVSYLVDKYKFVLGVNTQGCGSWK
jgi:hypothetical protein